MIREEKRVNGPDRQVRGRRRKKAAKERKIEADSSHKIDSEGRERQIRKKKKLSFAYSLLVLMSIQ